MQKLPSLLVLAALVVTGPARAADPLAEVDSVINAWKTIHYVYDVTTTEAGKSPNVLKLDIWMKSSKSAAEVNKLFMSINSGDMKGTKVLTLSKSQMYIYLPAFGKIRRIGSTDGSARFLGTALSSADMNLTRYSMYYTAKQVSDGKLELVAKPGSDAPYPLIDLTVDGNKRPTKIEYKNKGGKVIKTETREGYSACKGGYCTAKKMTVTDHAAGVTSVLKLAAHEINGKIKNGTFSKRNLK